MWIYIDNPWMIGEYTILQWLIYFMMYCIGGWIFESVYCSLKEGKLLNRGFCHGPWLPIYGTGATLCVMIGWPFRDNTLIIFLIGFLGGSALELVTGVVLYRIFHMKWWDYSKNPLNFHGYISFFSSLAWGFLALFIIRVVHPHVAHISRDWTYTYFIVANTCLYTLFAEDAVFSVIAALDLRDRLERLAENSEEIERLKANIAEIYVKLGEVHASVNETVQDIRQVREEEGNLAAAKALTEETADALSSAAAMGANTMKSVASSSASAAKSVAATGVNVAKSAAMTGVNVAKSMAATSANVAKNLLPEERRKLQFHKRRLEERLLLLQDGGGGEGEQYRGRMDWWSRTMLRNMVPRNELNHEFKKLREAAIREKDRKSNGKIKK